MEEHRSNSPDEEADVRQNQNTAPEEVAQVVGEKKLGIAWESENTEARDTGARDTEDTNVMAVAGIDTGDNTAERVLAAGSI